MAGAILAHTLIDRGLKVSCSEGKINYSASRIATGLINPFIGPKLNIPFEFKRCTEVNFHFFKKWEDESNEILLKPEPLLRVFKSKTQRNKWDEYTKNSDSSRYTLSFHSREKLAESEIMGKYGAGETQAFRLNVEKFLKLSRQKLESMDCWTEETFKHNISRITTQFFLPRAIMYLKILTSTGFHLHQHRVKYWNLLVQSLML